MKYAGIGPRDITQAGVDDIVKGAHQLSNLGFHLVSGHGKGADQAWERGAALNMQTIYIPYAEYNGARRYGNYKVLEPTESMVEIARKHHPAWDKCTEYVRSLMVRNVAILFSNTLDYPVEFVLYWQAEGVHKYKGGTGHSLRMADSFGIPNFNINIQSECDAFQELLEKLT